MVKEDKVDGVVRWKVIEGKTVELYYDDAVFRRMDHLLIEEKAKRDEKVQEIVSKGKPKYPPLTKKGDWLQDPVGYTIFKDHGFKIRAGVVDGLKEFLSTGYRTKMQVAEWFECVLGIKHGYALIQTKYYIHWLDANAKIETQVVDNQDAYRLREQKFETPML